MLDLHKALADIESIRSQVARGTQFRGYGPATVALTGVLAILAAGIQSVWLEDAREQIIGYLVLWIGTAGSGVVSPTEAWLNAEVRARSPRDIASCGRNTPKPCTERMALMPRTGWNERSNQTMFPASW